MLLGSAAQAGEHNFVLTAYTNGRGGQALVTGDYDAAGKALSYKPTLSAFDTQHQQQQPLCLAHRYKTVGCGAGSL